MTWSRNVWRMSWVLALVVAALTLPGRPASAATLPGGQTIYEFAVSNLADGAPTTPDTYFVRTGTYIFATDGTVTGTVWSWSQTERKGSAKAAANSCPADCYVLTPAGYQDGTGSSAKAVSGTWVQGTAGCAEICITWGSGSSATTETWSLTGSQSDLAKLSLVSSSYGGVTGWAYGGSHSVGYTISASYLRDHFAQTYSGYGCATANPRTGAAGSTVTCGTRGRSFNLADLTTCNTNCLTRVAACSSCQLTGNDKYYLATSASSPRKVWYEYYFIGDNTDYCPGTTQHEHLVALREIVGTTGKFYGFIGVEASVYPDSVPNNMEAMQIEYFTAGLPF